MKKCIILILMVLLMLPLIEAVTIENITIKSNGLNNTIEVFEQVNLTDFTVESDIIKFEEFIRTSIVYSVTNDTIMYDTSSGNVSINFTQNNSLIYILDKDEYCPDGTCDGWEDCTRCASDCGVCPVSPGGGRGSPILATICNMLGGVFEDGTCVPIEGVLYDILIYTEENSYIPEEVVTANIYLYNYEMIEERDIELVYYILSPGEEEYAKSKITIKEVPHCERDIITNLCPEPSYKLEREFKLPAETELGQWKVVVEKEGIQSFDTFEVVKFKLTRLLALVAAVGIIIYKRRKKNPKI